MRASLLPNSVQLLVVNLTGRGVGDGHCSSSCRAAVDFAKRDHLGAFDELRYLS